MCSLASLVVACRVMLLSTDSRWHWNISCCEKPAFLRVASFQFVEPLVMKAASSINVVSWCVMCARSCTGVAYNLIFVFTVRTNVATASYRTICNLEASEDWLRLSKLSPGETKGPQLVCRNTKPKICQSWLGVSFFKTRQWSAANLGLNICFFLPSRCRCLLSCFCESISCFFLHNHRWRYKEPEGINSSLSFLLRLSGNSGTSSKRYFPAGWRTVDMTAFLHCHQIVGIE